MSIGKKSISNKKLTTIILAAGKGKRMYSKMSKILHKILGKPIISFVVDLAKNIRSDEIIIVVGKNAKEVKQAIGDGVKYIVQSVPRGTGDAAKKGIDASTNNNVLILCGDVPLLQKDTIVKLLNNHKRANADLTFLTCEVRNPFGYGRIIRNRNNNIVGIVEQSDATPVQRKIKEINAGIYYGKKNLVLSALSKINIKNRQREFYLTDVVKETIKRRRKVVGLKIDNEEEILGINSKLDLARVRALVKLRWFEQLMSRGVYIEDPPSTIIDLSVQIGRFVHIRPHTIIEGKTQIKEGAIIGPFTWIKNGKKINFIKDA